MCAHVPAAAHEGVLEGAGSHTVRSTTHVYGLVCVCIVNPAHHMVATYPWVVRNAGGGLTMLDMLGMPRYVVQGLRSRSVARSLLVLAYRLV